MNLSDVPWRVGSKVGRTIYAVTDPQSNSVGCDGPKNDTLICVMDTRELAEHIVDLHNVSIFS